MLEKGKISARQFTILVFLFMIGTSILIVPSMVVSLAKQDGWISVLIGIVISLLSILLYYALAARYPDKTLAEYCELILGKWLGKLVSLFLMSYIFILTALLLRVVGNFMTMEIMPETPIEVIHILIVAVVIYAVRQGLETFSRTSEIMLPVILVLFLLFAVLLLKEIDVERIQPVMEWA